MIHVLKNGGLKRGAQAFFEHEAAGGVVLVAAVVLAGNGFTMRFFIGTLAFHGPEAGASVRADVLAGSVAFALVGYLVLHAALTAEQREKRHSISGCSIAP